MAEPEYILGTDALELERLGFQHRVWARQAYALWERAGIRAGDAVLDLGCGPGFAAFDLAALVGPQGRVIAVDESERFLAHLTRERDRQNLRQIDPHPGRVEELDLPPGSFDAAYARWLFCWLAEPGVALARVARALRPGGVITLQEYIDWAAMALVPRSETFERAVAACMRSWHDGGGTIDIGTRLPTLAEECGLRVEHLGPIARLGRVGSLEWRWIGSFYASYLPRLVTRDRFGADELAAFTVEWDRRTREGTSWIHTPLMLDAILRKRE
ncbi:MAG: methyltransferase domain-containing protein [Planctomycetota bacterium]